MNFSSREIQFTVLLSIMTAFHGGAKDRCVVMLVSFGESGLHCICAAGIIVERLTKLSVSLSSWSPICRCVDDAARGTHVYAHAAKHAQSRFWHAPSNPLSYCRPWQWDRVYARSRSRTPHRTNKHAPYNSGEPPTTYILWSNHLLIHQIKSWSHVKFKIIINLPVIVAC